MHTIVYTVNNYIAHNSFLFYSADMLDKIRKEIDKGYAKGMSIPQMAKAAGVSRNLPLMWYKGERKPSLENFMALKSGIRKHKTSEA